MSADNEICILELIDADKGHTEYRVADNVSMSYNILGIDDIDIKDKQQIAIVYNIWKDAKEFYHEKDALLYAQHLEENGYHEYGTSFYTIYKNWETVVKINKENQCKECHGLGLTDNHVTGEVECGSCEGTGLTKD